MTDVETLLAQIAEIGATADGGVRRLAWTDEDARLAQWFTAACTERGLEVSTDRCGNQWAWWGDPDAEVPPRPASERAERADGHRSDAGLHVGAPGAGGDAEPASGDGRHPDDGALSDGEVTGGVPAVAAE